MYHECVYKQGKFTNTNRQTRTDYLYAIQILVPCRDRIRDTQRGSRSLRHCANRVVSSRAVTVNVVSREHSRVVSVTSDSGRGIEHKERMRNRIIVISVRKHLNYSLSVIMTLARLKTINNHVKYTIL